MKAVVFQGADKPLSLESVDDPVPGEGEIVVEVGRCGICGTDIHLTAEHGNFAENTILGHEFAGEIVAVGKGVAGFKVGDAIAAMAGAGCGKCIGCVEHGPFMCEIGFTADGGGFAEFAKVKAHTAIKLPSTLSLTDGALVEPLAVSLHGVKLAQFTPGSRVLVLGAGAIGLGAVYWARKLGAGRVAAASRSDARAALSLAMGADAFVTTGEGEAERVAEALGGPPDVVIECIGVVGALQQAISLVRPNGTIVSLGFCGRPDPVLPALATFKQVRLIFSMAYSLSEFQFTADMLSRGHVEPRQMVSEASVTLDAVPQLIADLRQARSPTKLHVDPTLTR